ncbi:MAG TPA: EpsI family protein [Candidatus Deferrimicrobium sp.]|nr:EpsI family protein [Candidatus Deferrimicrobium sp.]
MKSVVTASIVIAAAGLFGNYLRFSNRMPDRQPAFSGIPFEVGDYSGEEHRFSDQSYDVLKADTTTLRMYRDSAGVTYWLFVAYFSSQKYGSQIHSPKHCLPGGGWKIQKIEPYRLALQDGSRKEINRVLIADRERQQAMFYWFETRGGAIRDEFGLKWDLMMNSLMFRPTDAAFIRLTVPLGNESLQQATARAERFFAAFYPPLEGSLPFHN